MNINKGRCVRYILLLVAMTAPVISFSADAVVDLILDNPGKPVSFQEKHFARHTMVAGPLAYRKARTAGEREGYQPKKEVVVEGSLRRDVLDFGMQVSAHALFRKAQRSLKKAGYGIEYRCQRESCGDAQGWTLFFPSQVDGRTEAQYYLLARFPVEGLAEKYLTLHVTDISSQPRVTIDQVTVLSDKPDHMAAYAREMEALVKSEALAGPLVRFRFDSATLDKRSRLILKATKQVLEKNKHWTLELVGHADDRGDQSYNLGLSEQRASAVRNYLVGQGVAESRLSMRGEGAATPVDVASEQWRSAQRRVDLLMSGERQGNASNENAQQGEAKAGS